MRKVGGVGLAIGLAVITAAVLGLFLREMQDPASAQRESCRPLLVNWSGHYQQCFLPLQVVEAERLLPVSPVDPRTAVLRVMHVDLKQIIVSRFVPHDGAAIGEPIAQMSVTGIAYIFGRIPGDSDMIPMPTPAEPRFVMVNEDVLQADEKAGERIDRAAGTVSDRPGEIYGPWELDASLPSKRLSLSVESNADAGTLRVLGDALITGQ